jgi:hypothetical protein
MVVAAIHPDDDLHVVDILDLDRIDDHIDNLDLDQILYN